jgi:hypothetical protein
VTVKTKAPQLGLKFLPFVAEHLSDVLAQLQKGIDIHRLKIEMSFSHDVTPSKSQSVIDLATSKASTRALRLSPLARIPSADGLRPAHLQSLTCLATAWAARPPATLFRCIRQWNKIMIKAPP